MECTRFLDSQIYTDTLGNARRDIIAFIKNTNADIVCIQDFTERISPAFRSSVNDVRNTFNYPNYFFRQILLLNMETSPLNMVQPFIQNIQL